MTDTLIKSPNTAAPDDLYEQLLANHIGDPDVLSEAIELAKNRSE